MNDYEARQQDGETSETEFQLAVRDYVRFVALGDSASCGVGDPTPGGWRGWARILADAIAVDHHVSFCKLAVAGATVADVRREQLTEALDHRPVIASLVVGLNDAMRSTWDREQIREDLLHCAGELARQGALVVTVRFHDHTRVLGLPALLARPLQRHIQTLNEIYDEVHERYGALRLDLAADPAIYSPGGSGQPTGCTLRARPPTPGPPSRPADRRRRPRVWTTVVDLHQRAPEAERDGAHDGRRRRPMDRPPRPRSCPLGPAHQALSRARGVLRPSVA